MKKWFISREKREAAYLLRTSAGVLDTYGWVRNVLVDEETGARCALGALIKAKKILGNTVSFRANNTAQIAVEDVIGMNIVRFNDAVATGKEDVTSAFLKAASTLDGKK